jgi:hypothetical protein
MSELSTADLAGGTTRPTTENEMQSEMRDRDRDGMPDRMQTAASTSTAPRATGPTTDGATPLFPTDEASGFRSRWTEVQTGFVDEPRSAVEQADGLVADMMKRLAQVFADERAKLEEQWSRGDDISTEDLRVALQRYRSFFDRLLAV